VRTVHDPAPHRRPFRRARAWLQDVVRAEGRTPSPPTLEAFFDEARWTSS
jgi:hypothetical protein